MVQVLQCNGTSEPSEHQKFQRSQIEPSSELPYKHFHFPTNIHLASSLQIYKTFQVLTKRIKIINFTN